MKAISFIAALAAAINAVAQVSVVAPAMARRAIAPGTNELRGTQITLADCGTNFTLFLPQDGLISSNTTLCIHFHTTPWFVIQEHLRREAKEPLLVFALGEGSSAYRVPFEDTNRLARVLALTEAELQKRSGSSNVRVTSVEISSFSAGYGAVRELVKRPAYFKIIARIILLDSMYGSLASQPESGKRAVLPEHIEVWLPFARAAMHGEKTFTFTHSQVPTSTYASSAECAAALIEKLAVRTQPALPDSEFPLLRRADTNGLHVWSYGGTNALAHLTHARHMADVWKALDAANVRSRAPQ